MDGPTLQIERLVRALQWALPLAEEAHEQHYPGETYDKDNYVARQVQHARDAPVSYTHLTLPTIYSV